MRYQGCNFGWDADIIAVEHGIRIKRPLGFGDDGSVFLLEDGRVMKLTTSRDEAVLCTHLAMDRTAYWPLPTVHAVSWHAAPGVHGDCWVVIREDVPDLWQSADTFSDDACMAKAEAWDAAHHRYYSGETGWPDDGHRAAQACIEDWAAYGTEMGLLMEALSFVGERLGVAIQDWRTTNVGRSADGRVVMRDLSRCVLPTWMYDAVPLS